MADVGFGVMGAILGSAIPGVGPWLGFSIGMTMGNIFFGPKPRLEGARMDVRIGGASQAAPIPIIFGSMRVAGNIIWAPDLVESSDTQGGGSLGGPTFTNYSYTADLGVMFCQGEITRFNKIWADAELIYDYNGGDEKWAEYIDPDKVTMYVGSMSQTVDPLIDAERTAAGDEAPAYLGRSYIVFETFPWSRFGHTPNFTAEVVRGTSVTLSSILEELFQRVGIAEAELDMSDLDGVTVSGFIIPSRQELTSALEGLLRAYNADIVEVDGLLRGVLKDVSPSFSLDSKWLGCSTNGTPPTTKIETTHGNPLEKPRSVDVTCFAQGHDYQQFTHRAVRLAVDSQGESTLDLNLVLSNNHGRRIAETILYEEWCAIDQYKTTHPLMYLSVAPGDVGTIEIDGRTVTVRVVDQFIGLFGHVETHLVRHESAVYTQYVEGAEPPGGGNVSEPGLFTIWANDIPALRDSDTYSNGQSFEGNQTGSAVIYFAATRAYQGWPGALLIADPELVADGASQFLYADKRAVIGETDTELGSAPHGLWDRTNTVDVTLVNGSLASATEAQVLNGANLCVIGNEILQFATATLIGTLQYRLSNLLRGRRGTEWAIDVHASGEQFVLANMGVVRSAGFDSWQHGLDVNLRISSAQVGVSGSNEIDLTLRSYSRKPYSPCDIRGSRDGSNNLTITWKRRSRRRSSGLLASPPLDESSEAYEVDIMDGASVVRTISSTSPTATYTAAQQITDFGSEQISLTVNVYQMSPGWGRGFGRQATL